MATSKSARDLREMAEATATSVHDSVRHNSKEIVEDIREKATEAGEAVRHAVENVKERGDRLVGDLSDLISRRPLPSILIAAGIGFLIGGAAFGQRLTKRR